MSEWIAAVALLAGAFFVLVAAIGVVRMPDLFTRMHAATKAGTLGVALVVVAAAVTFGTTGVTTKSALIVAFLLFTAPVGAHVLGRAAYFDGVETWDRTDSDALEGKYDERSGPAESRS